MVLLSQLLDITLDHFSFISQVRNCVTEIQLAEEKKVRGKGREKTHYGHQDSVVWGRGCGKVSGSGLDFTH